MPPYVGMKEKNKIGGYIQCIRRIKLLFQVNGACLEYIDVVVVREETEE